MTTNQVIDQDPVGISFAEEDEFRSALAATSSIIRDGFAFWQSRGPANRLPRREDFNPFDVPVLMPHMLLLDVFDDPRDFCYRVIGTTVCAHLAQNLTGMRMTEIEHQRPPSKIWDNCEKVAESRLQRNFGAVYFDEGGGQWPTLAFSGWEPVFCCGYRRRRPVTFQRLRRHPGAAG